MDINLTKKRPFILVPPVGVSVFVLLLLCLPYVALRYSSTTLISLSYAFFVVTMLALGIVFTIARVKWSREPFVVTTVLLIVTIYGAFNGFLSGWTIYDIAKSAYEQTAPILLFFLILLSRIATSDLKRALITPLLWFAFFNAIYSVYQYLYIDDYTELWFYEPLTRMGYELHEWSYERGGEIRVTGLFTSPLENIYILSIVCIYFALQTMKNNWKYIFALIFYLAIGYATSVRIFFVGFVVVFIFFLFYQRLGPRLPFVQLMLIPLVSIVSTYLGLYVYADRVDLSSLGRLNQFNEMLTLLFSHPQGLGFGSVGIARMFTFDSVYNTWLISLGVVSGVALIYMYYWSSKKLLLSVSSAIERSDFIILLTLIMFSVYLMYVSQFQYAMNVSSRWYYVIAASVVINTIEMKRRKKVFMASANG